MPRDATSMLVLIGWRQIIECAMVCPLLFQVQPQFYTQFCSNA